MHEFEALLIEAAEAADRKDAPAILALKKEGYLFCRELGLSDAEIQETMALTGHQMRLLKKMLTH
jgi:hypothetical protein